MLKCFCWKNENPQQYVVMLKVLFYFLEFRLSGKEECFAFNGVHNARNLKPQT